MKKAARFAQSLLVFAATLLCTIGVSYASVLTIDGWNVKYWRNHPLGTPNTTFDQAVIVIHGTSRNAGDYYDYIVTAAQTENVLNHTLILAPQFKTAEDVPNNKELYWTQSGWKKGFKAVNGNRISSYQVVDHILGRINENFPNITFVTISGHSAGGQFVQRYGALNVKEQTLRADINVRYVIANPGSYMYLSADRPRSINNCSNYNNYKYGIAVLPGVLEYTNLPQTSIQSQLVSRSYYLLLGTKDNDPNSVNLDVSCEANAQGAHRYERGLLYYEHVKNFRTSGNHAFSEVPGIGHDADAMFNSIQGRKAIFHRSND